MTAPGRGSQGPQSGNVPVQEMGEMPGRQALLLGALALGVLMLAMQLWLLTVALELFLSGEGEGIWALALVSGTLFAGGLLASWLLARKPKVATRAR